MGTRIIIVDGGGTLAELTTPVLRQAGFEVESVGGPSDVVPGGDGSTGVVVMEACRPWPGGPPAMVGELKRQSGLPILQVSGCAAVDAASRSHPVRADAYLIRPFGAAELLTAIEGLVSTSRKRKGDFHGMYAGSAAMEKVFEAVRLVAPSDSTVLITGATGTGKEMVARAIHERSRVSEGPFIPLDCGSLPESLLASELFGHTRGAFTGASADRHGLIEAARGGTLFLDEVCNTPPRLQMLLLRAIQERHVRRVGDTRLIPVDTRFVAATSSDLRNEVDQGRFRRDLYYRLKIFPIDLPPLRERKADIDCIVDAYLGGEPPSHARPGIMPGARELLRAYRWPGNVRELLGVLETARLRARGGPIGVEHLPAEMLAELVGKRDEDDDTQGRPEEQLTESERILLALHRCDGNRTRAARLLDISRTTLWRRIRSLDLDPPSPR